MATIIAIFTNSPQAAEAIPAKVAVNSTPQLPVVLTRDDGGLSVPVDAFRSWNLTPPPEAIEGERVRLALVPWLRATLDEATVTLLVNVDPERLPRRTITMRPRYADAITVDQASGFLNYGLTAISNAAPAATLEAGLRRYGVLFYSSGVVDRGEYRRLQLAAVHDSRDAMRRTTAGDFFSRPGALTSSFPMFGLSVATERRIDPYRTLYPALSLSTAAALPSEVEVRVDGQVVKRQRVPAGPIEIEGLTAAYGARDVQVVVRDSLGRESVIAQPFFFSDQVLGAGVSEYSYSLGAIRTGYGSAHDRLGPLALVAAHRYGISDRLTLGFAVQAIGQGFNAGPDLAVASRLGVVNVTASRADNGASAAAIAYRYSAGKFGLSANARRIGAGYTMLPNWEQMPASEAFSTSASLALGPGHLTLGYGEATGAAPIWSAAYSANIGRRTWIAGTIARQAGEWTAGLQLRIELGRDYSARATLGENAGAEITRQVPHGEGWGGGVRASRYGAEAYAQLNAEYALLRARVNSEQSLTVAGGIGCVAERCFASRPITDAFALVRVADLEGVTVHAGSAQAVTDHRGEAVLPLASYTRNAIRIDGRALPIEYTYGASSVAVSPAFRSGALVDLGVRKLRAIVGHLVDQHGAPIASQAFVLDREGASIEAFTGPDAAFYAEGVTPGAWTLRAQGCAAEIQIPEDTFAELGSVVCK